MPIIKKLYYKIRSGDQRELDLIGSTERLGNSQITLITGKNGSHKSTILRELVAALATKDASEKIEVEGEAKIAGPIICISGSVADRFPTKETGGRRTEFDVPGYLYLGQRVGNNLLSKKRPVETLLAAALDEKVHDRFGSNFFKFSHEFAGLTPRLNCIMRSKIPPKKYGARTEGLYRAAELAANGRNREGSRGLQLSQPMAQYFLDTFRYETFDELDRFLRREGGRRQLEISMGGDLGIFPSSLLSAQAVRLGLLAELITLVDAEVKSRRHNAKFSVFDLSSGEYQMLTTLLGLGFGLRDDAVVLIDEPENSLHPQWQQEYMAAVFEMCADISRVHIIISTHSPLIIGTAETGSTVIDLSDDREVVSQAGLTGASADDVLFEQFGVASSRNRFVVDIVQRAVMLVEEGERNGVRFQELVESLHRLKRQLRPDDPLVDVVVALLNEGE